MWTLLCNALFVTLYTYICIYMRNGVSVMLKMNFTLFLKSHVHGKNLLFSIDQYPPAYYIFPSCGINPKQFFGSDVKYLYEIFNAVYFSCFDVRIVCNISSSVTTNFPCPIPKSRKRKKRRKKRKLTLPNFTVYRRYSQMKMKIISQLFIKRQRNFY